jgi:hypothetical protein
MLDLGQFKSVDDAVLKLDPGSRYFNVAELLFPLPPGGMPTNVQFYFWAAMITRSEALHGAIWREAKASNPQATFALLRAFLESLVMVMYVLDHPRYVGALMDHPRNRAKDTPKRRTMQSLLSHAAKYAPNIKEVYAELSEFTHLGSAALWTSHVPGERDELGQLSVTWQTAPSWRNDEQAYIACAHTLELADGMDFYLRGFTERYILPLREARAAQALGSDS